jgi:phosphocarrier protein FPr
MSETPNTLVIKTPIAGVLFPLEQVPDPVFAQKLVGDGVSIDPVGDTLKAPCNGKIIQVHPCRHAVTMQTVEGIEIMMHIGLDTVHLKGEGFEARVKPGDTVTTGQPLIVFQPDAVALRAKSLLTQVIITTPERATISRMVQTPFLDDSADLFHLQILARTAEVHDEDERKVTSEAVSIPNPNGLHARPAAILAQFGKRFSCLIHLWKGENHADVRSVSGIMALDVRRGDKVLLVAQGKDAQAAIDCLTLQLREGLGEDLTAPALGTGSGPGTLVGAAQASTDIPVKPGTVHLPAGAVAGIPASAGLAIGKTRQRRRKSWKIPETGDSPEQERRHFSEACEKAQRQLYALRERLLSNKETQKAEIFQAHAGLLEDPELLSAVESGIAKGKSAARAWENAFQSHAERLESLRNELLAARAGDLRDVGNRLLEHLQGDSATEQADQEIPAGSILIAEELTPSETAGFQPGTISGFVTVGGGATSHVAIMARSGGIPALVGTGPGILAIADDTTAILDADRGFVQFNPTPAELAEAEAGIRRQTERREQQKAEARKPAKTGDGHEIMVLANLGETASGKNAVESGCDGVGLLRSEFLFLHRPSPPTEDEQFAGYRALSEALGPERTLTIRLLDIGGDKPLPFLAVPREENPFLGERGIRLLFQRPDIMEPQIRAILRAAQHGRIQAMVPMITDVREIIEVKHLFNRIAGELGVKPIPVGVMIEVPAAALLAEAMAEAADFFSLGTNDLTQYTLAMDRGHPRLAPHIDSLHPSVLRLIEMTVHGAAVHKKSVSICGGMAGDPQAIPILFGLGVTKFSVDIPSVPGIKALVRRLSHAACRDLAVRALALASPVEVRQAAADFFTRL